MTDPKPEDENLNLIPAEQQALREMLKDRLWWDEAIKRGSRLGVIIVGIASALAFLAVWWPWITNVAQAVLKDVPR